MKEARTVVTSGLWVLTEEHEGALWSDRNVLYLDVVGGHICKSPLRYTHKFRAFYCRYVMGQLKNKHTSNYSKFFTSPTVAETVL